ncbi:MAG: fasciclin domain-containing protein [Bacteroidia bacterium]
MKKLFSGLMAAATITFLSFSCTTTSTEENTETTVVEEEAAGIGGGQSAVNDDVSAKDIVKVAIASPDHTTLVKAVQAADLVNSLANAGPFTVFAPVNAAFEALPAGTVENLLKPENKDALADILQYHVTVSTYDIDRLTDGQTLGQVNGQNVTVHVKDGKTMINDATILASVKASNGIVHVVDKVLLPTKK